MRRGIRSKLLLLYAVLADVNGELSLQTSYKRFWWPDYKQPSVYAVVSKMVKVGEIERSINTRGDAMLRITARGGRLLNQAMPFRKLQRKRWDGIWRLVVFDIPEKRKTSRDVLRMKLKSLGFGMWQKSVYVTPHDVMREMNEYLKAKGLFPSVVCFESRRTGFGDDREFADVVYATEKRNEAYLGIADDADGLWHFYKLKKISKRKFEQQFRELWTRYLELVESDPFLPFDLLPKRWYADDALRWVQRLSTIL